MRLIARDCGYVSQRFNYLKYGYLCQETRLPEAETKGKQQQRQPVVVMISLLEQQQMPSEGTESDDNTVLARGVTRET